MEVRMTFFWKRNLKRCVSGFLAAAISTLSVGMAYAAPGIGPGFDNLSPSDNLAVYQWGLKNDGKLRLNLRGLKTDSANDIYQSWTEWNQNGRIGIPPRSTEPSDFDYGSIDSIEGIDINLTSAIKQYESDNSERRDVIVALIDTGVDTEHAELKDAIWTNPGEIPGDGIDNDGNGYTDDIHGWNFYDNNNRVRYNKIADKHGTHAAGTIGAKRGNGGITGITDNAHVKIMVLKVLGQNGAGSPEAVINAIKYAEANGASICNLSLGSTKYLPELEEQIKNSSMLFVAAAGNGDMNGVGYDTDQSGVYPASFSSDNIISVANMMFNGELDVSSNYGAQTVDVAAPGSYILSTTPGNTFEFLTGTSMAAPIVTGIAAFVYSYRPDLSLLQVKEAILNTVVKEDCLSGKVSSGGYPDAYAAMNYGRENTDNTD